MKIMTHYKSYEALFVLFFWLKFVLNNCEIYYIRQIMI